jgi:hypothetical protein
LKARGLITAASPVFGILRSIIEFAGINSACKTIKALSRKLIERKRKSSAKSHRNGKIIKSEMVIRSEIDVKYVVIYNVLNEMRNQSARADGPNSVTVRRCIDRPVGWKMG